MNRIFRQDIHFYITALFCALLVPAAFFSRLLFSSSLDSAGAFLFSWILQSIIWAAILYQFCVPNSWLPYRRNSLRLVILVLFGAGMILEFGLKLGTGAAIVGFTIAEFYFRRGDWKRAAGTLLPWLYLATGISVALFLSSVIVTIRPCTEYDMTLRHLDSLLMFGNSVIRLSGQCASLYVPAEFIYYSIGGAMGAALIFLCLAGDRQSAFQMSGAILAAYYISLVVFFVIPAQGPFIFASLPPSLLTASIQGMSVSNAKILYHHSGWIDPPRAYYVAFPSMHLAQPLIAAWFLRRWRVVSAVLYAYCVLLTGAIIVLRWHYVVDILGGLAVAVLAVSIVSAGSRRFGASVEKKPLEHAGLTWSKTGNTIS
jgi:hypothetical protein